MKVAVVGGGLAGLAAACDLVDAGTEVTLLEARPTLGGAVQTLPEREGDPQPPPDNGQHIALGCFTEYLRFLDRIGESRLVRRERLALPVIAEDGSSSSIAPSLGALLTYKHLPPRDRLRLLLVLARLRNAQAREDESFGGLLRRLGTSTAAIDRFWDVFIRPALNLPAGEADANAGLFTVRTSLLGPRANSDLVLPVRPLGAMHGDAAGQVLGDRVRLGERVESLDDLDADGIVLAVPPRESARLLGEPDTQLEDSPIVSVHLWFDRILLRTALAALLDSDAHWVFDRGALTGRRPEGGGQYLTVVSSGAPGASRSAWARARRAHRRAAHRAARPGRAALVAGQPRAPGHRRPAARRRAARSGDDPPRRRPCGDVDRHRLARDDGERRPQRPAGGSASAERPACESGRMTATAQLTALDEALDRGTRRLLELQRPDGIWVGELESNVTMTAQHLYWHHLLGLRTPDLDRRIANELAARMRDDGTWSIWFEGPPDLSTSVEAYVALRMCGVDPGPRALAYIKREGGIPKSRLFTKCFMALLGQWPWQRMVLIPPELVLLPPSAPFSIYNFACWARQTFVALSVAQTLRPVRPIDVDLTEIGAISGKTRPPRRPGQLRRRALQKPSAGSASRQEADGSWGGIQPPWVWGIIALTALGHGFEDGDLRRAVEGWQGFMVEDGDRLRPEACQSPVWDTGLALLALRAAGIPADHPQLAKAGSTCCARRSRSGATGPSADRSSRPAAGPSSTRTTFTPTSTTRR